MNNAAVHHHINIDIDLLAVAIIWIDMIWYFECNRLSKQLMCFCFIQSISELLQYASAQKVADDLWAWR